MIFVATTTNTSMSLADQLQISPSTNALLFTVFTDHPVFFGNEQSRGVEQNALSAAGTAKWIHNSKFNTASDRQSQSHPKLRYALQCTRFLPSRLAVPILAQPPSGQTVRQLALRTPSRPTTPFYEFMQGLRPPLGFSSSQTKKCLLKSVKILFFDIYIKTTGSKRAAS